MAVHLVTGYQGQAHITSADQGAFNAGCIGTGDYVLAVGGKLEAQIMSSTTIRLLDGSISMQGRHITLDTGTFMDINIASGSQGMVRNDLIVARYTKDTTTGVESVSIVVLKGMAHQSVVSDPTYTTGNILSGATLHEMPLYRVKMSGVEIEAVEPMFAVVSPLANIHHGFYKQNMLINGDFQCNQRGQTSYDVTTEAKYTVDMWRAYQVKVQVLNEGVTLTGKSTTEQGYFTQFIPLGKLKTTTYTISAMVDGKLHTFTVTPGGTAKERNFGKFKISCLTTSTWDTPYGDYRNKLKINICPVGTNTFTVSYVDVFEGAIAYPHVKEDYATAIMRCRQFIQKGCYVSPILHDAQVGSTYQYQVAIAYDAMQETALTPVKLETGTWSYLMTDTQSTNGTFKSTTNESPNDILTLYTSSAEQIYEDSHGVKGTYLLTCEPRDA